MRIGIVLSTAEPETVWSVLRFANTAMEAGDDVSIFLLGHGVEYLAAGSARFDIEEQARTFTDYGGRVLACGKCLRLRGTEESELCRLSNMKELHEVVKTSDRVLAF